MLRLVGRLPLLPLLLLLLRPLLLMSEKLVLFICVENACRSLMAEAIFNADPPEGWRAISGGTSPASSANPRTREMLYELGLELPPHPPQLVSGRIMDEAKVRVTMGCLDDASCPARLKSLELRDWALPDPASLEDRGFRAIRDEIVMRVGGLRKELALRDRLGAARPPRAGA